MKYLGIEVSDEVTSLECYVEAAGCDMVGEDSVICDSMTVLLNSISEE